MIEAQVRKVGTIDLALAILSLIWASSVLPFATKFDLFLPTLRKYLMMLMLGYFYISSTK